MAISLKATGAWVENVAATPAVTLVGTPAAGDRHYIWATWKTVSITASMVAGWNEVTEFADGAVATGNGLGSMKVACWYRDWQAGDGNPTLTFSTATNLLSGIVCQLWQKGADETWDTPAFATAAWPAQTTGAVNASSSSNVPPLSVVMCLQGFRNDLAAITRAASDISASPALTWNGNVVESPATHRTSATGNDQAADLAHRFVTVGHTATTLSVNATISTADTGAILWVIQGITHSKIDTISDPFNSPGFDAALWDTFGAVPVIENNTLKCEHTASAGSESRLKTKTFYDLTGVAASVAVLDYGNQILSSHEAVFALDSVTGDLLWFSAFQNTLRAITYVSGAQLDRAVTSLDPVAHKWLQLRESGGTVFWETSPDRVTWNELVSLASPFGMTSLKLSVKSGSWATQATGSYAIFDNFNVIPVSAKAYQYPLLAVHRASIY